MVVITSRFCGPPNSGNGGYCCGVLSERVEGPAQVTLREPPPLDVPLSFEGEGNKVRLLHDGTVIGEAHAARPELDVPEPPSFAEAKTSAERYVGFVNHLFPTCFTCGPQRTEGDGLRIFPGSARDGSLVAAPWIPHEADAGEDGRVRPAILWAALDCPGYFGAAAGKMALLGRMTAEVRDDVPVGEHCVVIGWKLGEEGRKTFAGTALFGAGGEMLGCASQVWIEIGG